MSASNHRSRGGKGGAEPQARILARRWRAWELSVQGCSQREIADALNVSQSAVSKMLKRAGSEMCEQLRTQTGVHIARQCSQLEYVIREGLGAWEKSKLDGTRRRHQRVEHGAAAEGPSAAKTTTEAIATNREGDPRHLITTLQAMRERRELLTLVAVPPASMQRFSQDELWRKEGEFLKTLTDEELVVMHGVARKRLMFRSEVAHPTAPDRDLQNLIVEVCTQRHAADEKPIAFDTSLPPAQTSDCSGVPRKKGDPRDNET